MRGNTDRPVELFGKDEFQIEPYVTGIAEFIEECDTPMTIAIQGDWGCGKTSMMNMTRDYLKQKESIVDIWFNTWQFSQFNMDEQLVITFLQHMINQLSKEIGDMNSRKIAFEKITPILKNITVGMTKQFVGSEIGSMVEGMVTERKLSIVDEIGELKSSFQELISKATNAGEKRVVIFIDDLDRLQPVRAVELLEVLKLFMDCDNCVFVMAIDTSVVFQGIREKYGNDMSDEKAQSFFDKMIQMPFKMPIAYYQLSDMMERLLDFLQDEDMSAKEKMEYVTLFKKVTNGNPRSLKRLANLILLTEKVAEKKNIYSGELQSQKPVIRRILVTLSCIQMKYEWVYNFLVNDMTFKRMDDLLQMKIPSSDDGARGKMLIEALVKNGMPDLEIEDKLVFYDVIICYIAALKLYVRCVDKGMTTSSMAVRQLLKIVALNTVAEENEKEQLKKLPATNGEQSPDAEDNAAMKRDLSGSAKELYLGMCVMGKHREVYEELIQQGVYAPLHWFRIYDGYEAIKEMQRDHMPLKECVLYGIIDEVLCQYNPERTVKEYEGRVTSCYQKDLHYACIKFSFVFDQAERALFLDGKVTSEHMRPMKETALFVDTLMSIYGQLQELYSDKIIRKENRIIDVKRNEEGDIEELWFYSFPILNVEMANAVIEYVTFVFQNMETYYQKKASEYNSKGGDVRVLLLKAAGSAPKEEE